MKLTAKFWDLVRREMDGTGIGTDHALESLWDRFKDVLFKRPYEMIKLETPYAQVALAAANVAVATFTVPANKTLKIWDHGALWDDAQVTFRLRNTTDAANVLAAVGPGLAVELSVDTGKEAPLATVGPFTVVKVLQFQASNADGAANHNGGAWIKATLE